MKIFLLSAFLLCGAFQIAAQDATGVWKGALDIQGTKLSIVFKIAKTDAGYISKMDSPDHGAFDIETTSTTFEKNIINIKLASAGVDYTGELKSDDTIEGVFKQGGAYEIVRKI